MSLRSLALREDDERTTSHVQNVIGAALVANAKFLKMNTGAVADDQVFFAVDQKGLLLTRKGRELDEDKEANELMNKIHNEFVNGKIVALDSFPGPNATEIENYISGISESQLEDLFEDETKRRAIIESKGLSAATWETDTSVENSYASEKGRGGYNFTTKINVGSVPIWMKTMLTTENGVPSTVIVRNSIIESLQKSRFTVKNLMRELMIMAYASRKGVGPRQYFAYVKLNPRVLEITHGDRVSNVYFNNSFARDYSIGQASVAEAFDGDCSDETALNAANYWEKVVETIVKASKCGVVHGDLKRANVLYRMDPTNPNQIKEMVYTDFDPRFVFVIDTDVVGSLVPCIAWLMLMCYLSEIRCKMSKMTDEALARAIDKSVDLMRQNCPPEKVDPSVSIGRLCDLGILSYNVRHFSDESGPDGEATEESVMKASKVSIVSALRMHMFNYWQRRVGAEKSKVNARCMRYEKWPPDDFGGRAKPGGAASMIDRLIQYALEGKDHWAM